MASGWYTTGLKEVIDATPTIALSAIRLMLIDTSPAYTFDPEEDAVSTALAGSELSDANYTGGHNGVSRIALSNPAWTVVKSGTSGYVSIRVDANSVWSGLAGGDTVAAVVGMKAGTTDDTDARPIFYIDISDLLLGAGDFTVKWLDNSGDVVRFPVQ